MTHTICLLSGERGTGKDTFYTDIINDRVNDKWTIFKDPTNPLIDINDILRLTHKANFIQRNLAANLKYTCWNLLFETTCNLDTIDLAKDQQLKNLNYTLTKQAIKLFEVNPRFNLDMTFREFIIEFDRESDPNRWVKSTIDDLDLTDKILWITDHRYPSHYQYIVEKFNLPITFRLFRSQIPLTNVLSERLLDQFKADYLVLSNVNTDFEFKEACSHFPQYQNYVRV